MKLAAIAVLAFLSSQQTPTPQQQPSVKGFIEGIVVRVGTNEPIAGARVTLSRDTLITASIAGPANAPPPGATLVAVAQSGVPPSPLAAIPAVSTDSQGKFVFKDVDAGAYLVQVASNGYAKTEYGQRLFNGRGTPVHVTAGQTLKDIAIRMTPAGTVTGRISDAAGRPLVGVPVQLLRPIYNLTGQRTFQSGGSTRTNDRGEYRLYWVTPGRYYLNAASQQGLPLNVGLPAAAPVLTKFRARMCRLIIPV